MNEGFILLIVLILMGLIGVTIYLVMDYKKYKTDTDASFSKNKETISAVQTSVESESNTRLSNLKYVVDQVNAVNTDIDSEFTSNVKRIDTSLNSYSNVQAQWATGMNTFFTFNNNTVSNKSLSELNDPTAANIRLNLIKQTSLLGGVTIETVDAEATGKPIFKLCGKDAAGNVTTNCIKIPDANGNTFLTSVKPSGKIIMNTTTIFSDSTKVGIGLAQTGAPDSSLDIKLNDTSTNPLTIKNASGNTLFQVDKDGKITLPTGHTITVDAANGNTLVFNDGKSANVKINGNLTVTGNVIRNGTTTIA